MRREEIEILRDIRTEKVSNRKASEFVLRIGFTRDRYGKRHPRAFGGFTFIRCRDVSAGLAGRLLSKDPLARLGRHLVANQNIEIAAA